MENHLIIGLGGTGGRVLAAYRKLVLERFQTLKPENIWVDYLYVDSSSSDLKMDNPKQWNMMGTSVKLSADSVVPIKAADLSTYVNNRSRYAYLAPWLGSDKEWQKIINDPKISDGAAGQKRRLGRLLFANGANDFNVRVDCKVRELCENNSNGRNITFHIVCGLAGGTGSGSVIDVIAQIRKNYPSVDNYKIILYLLLPDEIPNKAWASTDNYQPNGYVALKEINALDLKKLQPWDVGERKYDVKQLSLELPFYSAYLITEQNTENISFDVQSVVPSSIAEFLFQKTIGSADVIQTGNETESEREFFHSAERGENPDYKDYGSTHSFKFMTYGIKRLAIPEEEIKEFFGYSFAQQGLHYILYKNLSTEKGYLNEPPVIDDLSSFVASRELKQKWFLTRDHLCLSVPVLEQHKVENWKSFREEYKIIDKIMQDTLEDSDIEFVSQLAAIENRTKAYFKKKFRSIREEGQNGVENFFADKQAHSVQPLSEFIVNHIEEDLFSQWKTGERSLFQINSILLALLNHLLEEKDNIHQMKANASMELRRLDQEIEGRKRDWADTSFFSKLGKKTGLGSSVDTKAAEFTDCVRKKYIMMTWNYGYDFAINLLNNIVELLKSVQENVKGTITTLSESAKDVNAEILTRCNEESEESQKRSMVIKHFNTKKIHELCSRSINVQDINNGHIDVLRNNIMARLNSEKNNFKDAKQKLTKSQILEAVETVGNELARSFFEDKTVSDKIQDYERLIGVNILEKLSEEFDANPTGLKNKFEQLVRQAAVMAKHNPSEVNDCGGGGIRESTFIILPELKENERFFNMVLDAIKEAAAKTNIKVSVGGRGNEIVVINLESNVTPRYLTSVNVLRQAHNKLFNSSSAEIARFETQLEDYGELPDLYKEDDATKAKREKEARESLIPTILFAKAMKILISQVDDETGKSYLQFIPEDEDGLPDFDKAVKLGRSLEKSVDLIEPNKIKPLEDAVQTKLMSDYKHIDKLDELRKIVVNEVKEILTAHNNNQNDPIVQIFNKAFKEVKSIIEKLKED